MRHLMMDDFDEAWKVYHDNKAWFPHVRKSHVRTRLESNQLILEDGVLITYHKNTSSRKVGRDTDVSVTAGSHMIHQIINSTPGKGNAQSVMNQFFDFVGTDVYLTVRSENTAANKFYDKIGMKKVGYINWSGGNMPGFVWKKECPACTNIEFMI